LGPDLGCTARHLTELSGIGAGEGPDRYLVDQHHRQRTSTQADDEAFDCVKMGPKTAVFGRARVGVGLLAWVHADVALS